MSINWEVPDWNIITSKDFNWTQVPRKDKNRLLSLAYTYLARSIRATYRLSQALARGAKGSLLEIRLGDGRVYRISRQQIARLNDDNAKFVSTVRHMSRRARRRPKSFTAEQARELKGTFGPVYFRGTALHELFLRGQFVRININDLPGVREGFATRATLTALLHMYVADNNRRNPANQAEIYPDALMQQLFDDPNTPPPFISYLDPQVSEKKLRAPLTAVTQQLLINAAQQGGVDLTPQDFTTFGIIARWNNRTDKKRFTREAFNSFYLQVIATLNYFTPSDIGAENIPPERAEDYRAIAQLFENGQNRAQMHADYVAVRDAKLAWDRNHPEEVRARDARKREQGKQKRNLAKVVREQQIRAQQFMQARQ